MTPISFEFYPPKTPESFERLKQTAIDLKSINPEFYSVTYGAGGSTRSMTHETVRMVKEATGLSAIPHIAGLGSTNEDISTLLSTYQEENIRNLVVLRGDMPTGQSTQGDFQYAHDLIKFIRKTTGDHFEITVAAYPEYHPESATTTSDIDNLKRKMDAGANNIITQYFYNPDAYFYFRDQCVLAGITSDLTVGVMPITNLVRLARFSDMCGAEIPLWMKKQMETLNDEKAAITAFGETFMQTFLKKLQDGGAPGFHFYTLNQSEPTLSICQQLLNQVK